MIGHDDEQCFVDVDLRASNKVHANEMNKAKKKIKPFSDAFIVSFLPSAYGQELSKYLTKPDITHYQRPNKIRMLAEFFGLEGDSRSQVWQSFLGYQPGISAARNALNICLTMVPSIFRVVFSTCANVVKLFTYFPFASMSNVCSKGAQKYNDGVKGVFWKIAEKTMQALSYVTAAIGGGGILSAFQYLFDGIKKGISSGLASHWQKIDSRPHSVSKVECKSVPESVSSHTVVRRSQSRSLFLASESESDFSSDSECECDLSESDTSIARTRSASDVRILLRHSAILVPTRAGTSTPVQAIPGGRRNTVG